MKNLTNTSNLKSMSQNAFQDGKIPFKIAEREEPCETYYKIYGSLRSSGPPPLIILHGGPGSGHEYLEPYNQIWTKYGIPVVFYDQIGCAASTHLREKKEKSFWQPSLFVAELENLLDHLQIGRDDGPGFHLLGHSWGAVLAIDFVANRQPRGLRRLLLAGGPADLQLFKRNIWKLIDGFPEMRRAINEAVQHNDFTSPAYLAALRHFRQIYTCRAHPWPREMLKNEEHQAADGTVRQRLLGSSPWLLNGSLENYSSIPLLSKIKVPTLVFNGEFDTARDNDMQLFVDNIPNVRWVKFPGASHMMHLDSQDLLEKTLKLVGEFLRETDAISVEVSSTH